MQPVLEYLGIIFIPILKLNKPHDFKLPNSYLFDFDFMGQEYEYPFVEEGVLFDKDKIFAALDT